MPRDHNQIMEAKLDVIIELLQNLLALELCRGGVRRTVIGKRIRVATAKVGKLLQGVKSEK